MPARQCSALSHMEEGRNQRHDVEGVSIGSPASESLGLATVRDGGRRDIDVLSTYVHVIT
jgi:hypothetical protein